jgi:hypothetical protein
MVPAHLGHGELNPDLGHDKDNFDDAESTSLITTAPNRLRGFGLILFHFTSIEDWISSQPLASFSLAKLGTLRSPVQKDVNSVQLEGGLDKLASVV